MFIFCFYNWNKLFKIYQAKAEQLETGRIKGGGTIGLYEMVK